MNQFLPSQQRSCFLLLAISLLTCLILLINVSFKIIMLHGLVFAVNSLLCPLITVLYLIALHQCTFKEQRHLLNIALVILYLFCIGVYILVNLPAAEYMHDNPVYEIIFEDIPKKFFATTISFALSFYVPHLIFCTKMSRALASPKCGLILALLGGLSFFCLDFYLLFSDPHAHSFKQIFSDSFLITSSLLFLIGLIYLLLIQTCGTKGSSHCKKLIDAKAQNYRCRRFESLLNISQTNLPVYTYLLCFAVAVLLMCLACEYRIVSFGKNSILAASCIFFPITMLISNLVAEFWGYKANITLTIVLIAAQLVFDTFLMGIVAFPSPAYFNLNPFYDYIMPRRIPASSLALFVTFVSNAFLLHYLKHSKWRIQRSLRILVANICASSLLCLVDYSMLYGGIYPYEQIINLATNVWVYKVLLTILTMPLMLWLCRVFEGKHRSQSMLSFSE